MMKKLVIIGAGGHGRVVADLAEQIGIYDQIMFLDDGTSLGAGTVIMAGAVVHTGAVLGKGVIVNTGATVDHDCCVSDFCHVAVGAHLAGTVSVGARTIIGAGAVEIKTLVDKGTYLGVPAIRRNTQMEISGKSGGGALLTNKGPLYRRLMQPIHMYMGVVA